MFVSLYTVLIYLISFAVGCRASLHGPMSRRIVRGYDIEITTFPHAVFLHFKSIRPSCCGSSLITLQAVVTSAFCLKELLAKNGEMHAFLGATIPMHSTVVRNITAFRIHPYYDHVKAKNDLGVAKFDRPVSIMRGINKIPIYKKSFHGDLIMYTAGWGKQWPRVLPDYADMRKLKASKQRLKTNPSCLNNTGIKPFPIFLCTVPIHGHHYSGDMGNGLIIKKPYKALVGVVAFMYKASTIYTNVVSLRDWVKRALRRLYGKQPLDKDCC